MKNTISYRRLKGLTWQLRDSDTGAIVTFTEGRYFNDSSTNCNIEDYLCWIDKAAKSDDLRFMTECNMEARIEMIDAITSDTLAEAAVKLENMVSPDDADEYAFAETLDDMLGPSVELHDIFFSVSNEALIELIMLVDTYFVSPYDSTQWYKDLCDWANDARKYIIRTRIGSRIKELRTEAKMSQQQLADKAGITKANVCNIEGGRYSVGIDVLYRIAEALNVTIELIEK